MALFQTHTLSHTIPSLPPLSYFSSKTHLQNSLFFSTTNVRPFSLSTQPRKLLCKPTLGKYVREDYLVKKMSAQEVEELVRGERSVPIIIDFYATWCGPCILMAQELEMVRGLPTLFFISPDPNKEAIRTEGLIPIQMMRDILDNEM
ncbi:Thioredoxin z, P,TRX z isoform 2 [Theobroma cacao]|uniref:Thioredoxin z, P,TRX z isoform 2 n=1 Tax=Theobroma cacao TaxID=3641 RepID=A0A061FY75_THECC|nr:Thioredoxin z, P,TRX z isoform 2 [Theobroma cacao]